MRSSLVRAGSLLGVLLGVLTAYCGGKISSSIGLPSPGGTSCPSATAVSSGASCEGSLQCAGQIEACGSTVTATCSCIDGRWGCPGVGCGSIGTPPSSGPGGVTCPAPDIVASGAACDTTQQCTGSPIGPCNASELCSCTGGQWECDGVSCGTGTGPGTGPGTGTGTGSGSGSGSGTGVVCYSPPPPLYPETMPGVFCPFSGAPGQPSSFCVSGDQCCEPPESAGTLSVCTPIGTACPVPGSTDWQCEGAPDCAALPGTVCCGTGTIQMQAPQPGCAPGGGTVASYPYVSGFTGTACVPSAKCTGGASFQVCSQNSDCTGDAGLTCTSVAPKGNGIGYCSTM